MILNTDKLHLVKLVEETLAHLDVLLCRPTLEEVRTWYRGLRPMIEIWLNGENSLNAAFTCNTVHVKFHYDAGHVELHVAPRANQKIKDRLVLEAAAIETLMAQLRLYSTRKAELE